MERLINLLGYQITWFVTVMGANHGKSAPAWIAASLLCAGHLAASSWRWLDVRLLALAAMLGIFLDGLLASTGLLHYSPATPAVPIGDCPLWILALWFAFSTTLTRSLGWLRGRIGWAVLLGAAGGPLSYWAAARGWGVVTFESPAWRGLLALAIGWGMSLAILSGAAARATKNVSTQQPALEEPDFP